MIPSFDRLVCLLDVYFLNVRRAIDIRPEYVYGVRANSWNEIVITWNIEKYRT